MKLVHPLVHPTRFAPLDGNSFRAGGIGKGALSEPQFTTGARKKIRNQLTSPRKRVLQKALPKGTQDARRHPQKTRTASLKIRCVK
jgi:hypothetical protein